ncbi:MAG: SUF system NifU family Fe-S cluster assembly protein [Calditrichaeota bacterium]|nr:SUF system NifU family Fe-S cluster assembly protein [Calditrichota bacterium]
MALDELYQEIILEHYKKPKNMGLLENADIKVEGKNPFCGDEIELAIKLKDDIIENVTFDGSGCAISQASASLMTEKIKGKSIVEVKKLISTFKKMVKGEDDSQVNRDNLEELLALQGVSEFPSRIKCALLAWNTLLLGLEEKLNKKAGEK